MRFPREEVENGWPSKLRHAGAQGVIEEVDASDQTVLLRLAQDPNPLAVTAERGTILAVAVRVELRRILVCRQPYFHLAEWQRRWNLTLASTRFLAG